MTDERPMKDDQLDRMIDEAARDYHEPPAADLDAIWARVEAAHFGATPMHGATAAVRSASSRAIAPRGLPRWWRPLVGIAATLVIGVAIGRMTVPRAAEGPAAPAAVVDVGTVIDGRTPSSAGTAVGGPVRPAATLSDPLQRVTYAYVARTTLLLDSLAVSTSLRGDARLAADAKQLLGTTRLLLDSPAATDPRMRALLEDLELVLAQVASLRSAPRAEDLTFIADAMTERDVVPRLRTVAASYSGY